jgi:hypothetical protein
LRRVFRKYQTKQKQQKSALPRKEESDTYAREWQRLSQIEIEEQRQAVQLAEKLDADKTRKEEELESRGQPQDAREIFAQTIPIFEDLGKKSWANEN